MALSHAHDNLIGKGYLQAIVVERDGMEQPDQLDQPDWTSPTGRLNQPGGLPTGRFASQPHSSA